MQPRHSETALRYQPHVDGLRAIAVLAVVGYHAFPGALPGGFTGVDIFFVISGYLISAILYREFAAEGAVGWRVGLWFYARRIRRIFPALAVMLLACYGLAFWALLPIELQKFSVHLAAGAGFCANLVFAKESGYFNAEAAANPLLHLWSLGIEEQFYLLWPLVVWITARSRIRFLPVAVFLAALSFGWDAHMSPAAAAAGFFLPQMRMWELLLGCALAASAPFGSSLWERAMPGRIGLVRAMANLASAIGLALIGIGLFRINSRMALPGIWTLLPTAGAACLLASGTDAWLNRRILAWDWLVWVGLISYPLYLWHWPLLSFAQITLTRPDSPLVKAAVILASVVLAWLTYEFVERPIRERARMPRVSFVLLGSMAMVAGLALFSYSRSGFPWRFPALVDELSNFRYDPAVWQRPGYFLFEDEDEADFATPPDDGRRPTLYLWGDSHAAALYPGLERRLGAKYRIVQRTTANLPPFLGYAGDRQTSHSGVNRYVFESIEREKPACVVLEANWPVYEWMNVEKTVAALRAAGVGRVVLVGPLPQWNISLPQQLCNYVRRHRLEPVPTRLSTGLQPKPQRVDAAMAAWCGRAGVEYVSPYHLLQSGGSFIVRLGDTPDSLIAFDYGHLTVAGSDYLVARFPEL